MSGPSDIDVNCIDQGYQPEQGRGRENSPLFLFVPSSSFSTLVSLVTLTDTEAIDIALFSYPFPNPVHPWQGARPPCLTAPTALA